MKHFTSAIVASLAVRAAAMAARPLDRACAKDSCLAQVHQGSSKKGFGDCKDFFRTTVIPAKVIITTITRSTFSFPTTVAGTLTDYVTSTYTASDTTTTTSVTTTETTLSSPVDKRAAPSGSHITSKTALPSYVSGACSNTVQYSSACSCIGATHGTTTLKARTSTKTKIIVTSAPNVVGTSTVATETDVILTETSTLYAVTDVLTSTQVLTVTPCSTTTGTPTVQLASPTALTSPSEDYDDDDFPLDNLPFNLTFYGLSTTSIRVNVNGNIALSSESNPYDDPDCCFYNMPLPAYESPSNEYDLYGTLRDTSLAPYWDDLYVYGDSGQGIFYDIEGSVGQRHLLIEWITSHFDDSTQYYHFILSIPESTSENVKYTYYEISDSGASATIGAQSKSENIYTQYSFDQNDITPGLELVYNPATNEFDLSNVGCAAGTDNNDNNNPV